MNNLFKKLRKHKALKNVRDSYLEELLNWYEEDAEDFYTNLPDEPLSEEQVKVIKNILK